MIVDESINHLRSKGHEQDRRSANDHIQSLSSTYIALYVLFQFFSLVYNTFVLSSDVLYLFLDIWSFQYSIFKVRFAATIPSCDSKNFVLLHHGLRPIKYHLNICSCASTSHIFICYLAWLIATVEMVRFELMTPCLQGRCSPNWATPPRVLASTYLPGPSPAKYCRPSGS